MGEFFGSLYCSLFEDFFGLPLADYLWGTSGSTQESNMFIGIGLSMIGISLFMCVCYYYILNHPRLCNWWGWSIVVIANAIINFVVGWQWVLKDYYADLMYKDDPATGKSVPLAIDTDNILAFGVTNAIISIIAFIIITYIIKWWSSNCSSAPF